MHLSQFTNHLSQHPYSLPHILPINFRMAFMSLYLIGVLILYSFPSLLHSWDSSQFHLLRFPHIRYTLFHAALQYFDKSSATTYIFHRHSRTAVQTASFQQPKAKGIVCQFFPFQNSLVLVSFLTPFHLHKASAMASKQ